MVTKYQIRNLDCADCALKIEKHLHSVNGVRSANLNFASLILTVDSDIPELIRPEVKSVEPDVELTALSRDAAGKVKYDKADFHIKSNLLSIFAAGTLFLVVLIFKNHFHKFSYGHFFEYGIAVSAWLTAGWKVLLAAFRTIHRGTLFDENVLMTIATVGAFLIHAPAEAAAVMIFYKVGEFLQNLALHRSRNSIRSLLAVRPSVAHVLRNGAVFDLPPEEVEKDEIVNVLPGEKIPLDGIIISGNSNIDTSALTGESRPSAVKAGDSVLAGEICLSGLLKVQVSRPFSQSSIVKLLEEVENASSRKAKTEKFISRIARVYTPIVVAAAAGLALLPPLVWPEEQFSVWLYRSLVLLVISCPCALVISIPLGFFGGIGGASKRGILIKGSHFLERLAAVQTVVFDKTGTLTKGIFAVREIVSAHRDISSEQLLKLAAAAEHYSAHPIAESIKKRAALEKFTPDETHFGGHTDIAGMGVATIYKNSRILAGNFKLMQREKIKVPQEYIKDAAVVYIAQDGVLCGRIEVGDALKEDSYKAISALKEIGIKNIFMLTGDSWDTAQAVAEKLGIDNVEASLLPHQKVEQLEKIMLASQKSQLAFVGDGINDAPVLARSDVGIAMGTLGSEAAIETADVIISGDNPLKVAEAVKIGRSTQAIVWQNIILALSVKLLFVILGAMGLASMWEAVFADVGTTLIAVANASRALRKH
ncbi:MAG: heavy metal translocating P-type ATPase [Chitinispirillales bacterium]|nr:heavy metal translocating P-type ATPase [Chitinispirillales bacterium]